MANAVLHRVWASSEARGAERCLLLALADVADNRGIAYPGVPYLAEMIRESSEYTDMLIKKLVKRGELFKIAGKGRGHVTRFAVLCGLNDLQIAQLKGVLESPFSAQQKGDSSTPIPEKKRVTPEGRKGVLPSDKRVTLRDAKQLTIEAYECPETPFGQNEIHHDPSLDPGGGGGRAPAHKNGLSTKKPPAHVVYLLAKGMGAAAEFAHLDPDAAMADFNARRDANIPIGVIVETWRVTPPAPGAIYEHQRPTQPDHAPDRPRRIAVGTQRGSSYTPTGGAELRDPGWQDRLIADAEARAKAEL